MSDLFAPAISALILGLLGSGHCLGMCGGLMGALTMAIPPQQRARRLRLLLAYNVGRIGSYVCAGLILGSLGWAISQTPFAHVMRVIAGLLLIAMGLYLAGWWSGLLHIEKLGKGIWRYLEPLTRRFLPVRTISGALMMGAVWGWLPCGLVYSTLLWATAQGSALDSALLMFCFGLGTCPVLLAIGITAERMTSFLQKRSIRILSGLLIILFGLWTIPGPHQAFLMGHG